MSDSFAGDGIVITDFGGSSEVGTSLAVQADGKIVLGGLRYMSDEAFFAVARYNADGSLDTSFSSDGLVTTSRDEVPGTVSLNGELQGLGGISVASQADGKIVLSGTSLNPVGEYVFALVRYNADGSLDSTFSGDGIVRTDVSPGDDYSRDMVIQPDGKIVSVGTNDAGRIDVDGFIFGGLNFAVTRHNSDGTLDTSFAGNGKAIFDFSYFGDPWPSADIGGSVALQADGKILVSGNSGLSTPGFALVRYNANGTLDTSFSYDGKVQFFDYDSYSSGLGSGYAKDDGAYIPV